MSQLEKGGATCPECGVINEFPPPGKKSVRCVSCNVEFAPQTPQVEHISHPPYVRPGGRSFDHDGVENTDYFN